MKISRATCYRGNYDTSIQSNTADTASPERATFASPATATTKILQNIQSDETKTLFFHQDAPTPQTHDCGRLPATNMVTESDSLRRFSWVRNIRLGADEQEFPPEWRVAATGWGNTCTPPVHAACARRPPPFGFSSVRRVTPFMSVQQFKKKKNHFFEHHAKLFTHACCSFCPPSPPLKDPPVPRPPLPSLVVFSMRLWIYGSASLRAFAVKWAICENKCYAGSVYSVRSNQNAECIFSTHPLNTKRDEWRIYSQRRLNVCVSLWEKSCLVTLRLTDEETRSKSWFSSK